MDKTITIGCPIRDRQWCVGLYLKHIYNLDYPKSLITLRFLVNNSTDRTEDLLYYFKSLHEKEYLSIDIIDYYRPMFLKDKRTLGVRDKIYRYLAEVRNDFLSYIPTDYLFSVDSDILVPRNSLKLLLSDRKNIVAGVIRNDFIVSPNAKYPEIKTNLLVSLPSKTSTRYLHYYGFPLGTVFEVDVTGAVYLLSSCVVDTVKYKYHKQGEDIGFCEEAKRLGFSIWADSRVYCRHLMAPMQLPCLECSKDCIKFLSDKDSNTLSDCKDRIPLRF